jgi:nucleotide-binding universal stress UspA family protein
MKTILFPTDFSENALHASEYAGMLADKFDAQVILLNVYSVPVATEYQVPYNITDFTSEMRAISETSIKDFTNKFVEITGLTKERISHKIEYGFVGETIIEMSKNLNIDMIVMGTKGASNAMDRWVGTTAQTVMKQAECPVWIIPEKVKVNYPQKFLYAADLMEDEVTASQKLMEFVKPFEANCKIIHIDDKFELNPESNVVSAINDLKEEYKDDDNVFVRTIRRDDVVEGLETYIQSYKPDVLALAVHDKSFLSKLFEQSVTNHFVYHADLSMLIFRK